MCMTTVGTSMSKEGKMSMMNDFMDEAFKAYHNGGVREVENLTLENLERFAGEMRSEIGFRGVVSKLLDYVQWQNKSSMGRLVGCTIAEVLNNHRLLPEFGRGVYSGMTTPKSIWERRQRIKNDGARAMERVKDNIRNRGWVSWKEDTAKEIMLAEICIPGVVNVHMDKHEAYDAVLGWINKKEEQA